MSLLLTLTTDRKICKGFKLIPSLLGMSLCKKNSDLQVLSTTLWSIVKDDKIDGFPDAVEIATKLFKALPNVISPNTFCDLILDLKIKV